jgi:hypothetical protein
MSLNLLPSQAKFQAEKIKAISLAKKILTIFLILWVFVVMIILGIEQGYKIWLNNQNVKYQDVVSNYMQSAQEIVVTQTIKFRAKLLGKVLADRFEYSDAFNVVGNIFDSNIVIKDFELKENRYFMMTVEASDSTAMTTLESRIKEINLLGSEPKVKNIVLNSASYSKSAKKWEVNLEVYLK